MYIYYLTKVLLSTMQTDTEDIKIYEIVLQKKRIFCNKKKKLFPF